MAEFAQILIRGKDDTAQAWASVQRNASDAIGRINGLIPGLAAALSVAGLIKFAHDALEAGEQINKLSQRTGIAVEELSALKFAASQANLPIEGLALGMKKLSVSAVAAMEQNSGMAATFRSMGVSVTDANGRIKGTLELLLSMADRFATMNDGAQKTALAVKVLGKAGDELIPFLNLGRERIAALNDEARRMGLVMSKDAAEAAERASDNLKVLRTGAQSLAVTFINDMAPALDRITSAMREAKIESGAWTSLWVGLGGIVAETFGLGMKEAAEKARELTIALANLRDKQREFNAELAKDPGDKRLQGWIKGVQSQIDAKQAELNVVQVQVDAEKERQKKGKKDLADIEQRTKDQSAVKAFIDNLKKEVSALSESKEAQMKWAAAQAASQIQTKDLANALIAQAAAMAKKIAAWQAAKAEVEAMVRLDKAQKEATDNATNSAIAHAEAMELEAKQWRLSNEEKRLAGTLAALVAAGVSEESEQYRNLQAKLYIANAQMERGNELRANSEARNNGLKSLQDEIAAIQFETATLILNNDQRERAQLIRKMSGAGINVLSDPQGAVSMDDLDAAQAERAKQRNLMNLEEQKKNLDQKSAQLIMSLATQQEAEQMHYDQESQILADARAQGLLSDQAYYAARERLQQNHSKKLTDIEDAARKQRHGADVVYKKLDFDSTQYFFNQLSGMMESNHRTMFEIGKKAAIADTIMRTYSSAQKSYDALAQIPYVGPVLGAAAAAAALVVGFARVQAIKSTHFNGGGTASGTVGTFNANPSTGQPESPISPAVQQVAPVPQAAVRPVQITHVYIGPDDGMFSKAWIRDTLIPGLNEANADGVKIIID